MATLEQIVSPADYIASVLDGFRNDPADDAYQNGYLSAMENIREDVTYTNVRTQIEGFIIDPPDTDFQRGYLAALVVLHLEAFGESSTAPLRIAAEALL